MVLIYILYDKGKLLTIVDPSARTDAVLRKYRDIRRDLQVLDHILTMEIKTHFILNLQRLTINTAANAWATRPPLPLGFTGELY